MRSRGMTINRQKRSGHIVVLMAWVLIYQRAYLQEMGVRWSDPNANEWVKRYGGDYQRGDTALLALTGQARWMGNNGSFSAVTLTGIQKSVDTRRPVVAITKGSYVSQYGLIEGHSYAVVGA